jgi:translation initiation factor 4E
VARGRELAARMSEDKHPLQSSWAFWEHRRGASSDYGSQMHILGTFNTVEGFWRFKNNIPNPSDVMFTTTGGQKKLADRDIEGFSLFKDGVRPEWEDPANMHGGEFFCRQAFSSQQLDDVWEKLTCGLVGETIDPEDEVCGARIVDKSKAGRPTYRVEMWIRNNPGPHADRLRNNLSNCLGGPLLKEYSDHGGSLSGHGGSKAKGGSGRGFK